MKGNILIGCEESQVVTQAFRNEGYNAFSCDLQPTRGIEEYHLQCDVIDAIKLMHWDLIILHPDCTAMAVSGNRWYGKGMPYHDRRLSSIEWTVNLWDIAKKNSRMAALENPVSVIFSNLTEDVQYIQPWQFGHGETKKTGLALYNLPFLKPTNIVEGREQRVWRMPPGKNRKRDRSETYKGIANAFVDQWGVLI